MLDMLANDKRRLDAHDIILADMQAQQTILKGKQTSLEKGQRVVCAGVMALLDHTLHNGNT